MTVLCNVLKLAFRNMSNRRSRFFPNPYPDFDTKSAAWTGVDTASLSNQVILMSGHIRTHGTADDSDGSLYVGPAGIAFAFYHKAINSPGSNPQKRDDLLTAQKFSEMNLEYARRHPRMSPGFLLGSSGAYAVSAAVHHALGEASAAENHAQKFAQIADTFLPLEVYSYGSDELLVGRAGYICGALWLNKQLSREVVPNTVLCRMCDSMVESGERYSRRHRSPCPLMYAYHGTEYLGAAHGLSSILQMILTVPGYFEGLPQDKKRLVVGSVDFLLGIQQESNGNFPCAMDEITRKRSSENELVHWCHGSPGTVYLMARAHKVLGDPKYLQSALSCGETAWSMGLLKKGPGICHGVAGSGYVFLLLHALTGDRKHLYRAQKFADFMQTEEFQQGARQPDCPLSLYEGWAGTMCYLVNLINHSSAVGQFPFFENCLD